MVRVQIGSFVRGCWGYVPVPVRACLWRVRSLLWRTLVISKNGLIRVRWKVLAAVPGFNQRATARAVWPDIHGIDHLALGLWGVLLRFHSSMLDVVWSQSWRLRRRRGARRDGFEARKVLHVTSSFDLGGTQTQIKNLCTSDATGFSHHANEIFPERNFLFRRGATVDPVRYFGRGVLYRTGGRLVTNPNYRSSQLVQMYMLAHDFRHERPEIVVGWGHEMCASTFVAAAVARVPYVVFCVRTLNPTNGWVPAWLATMLLHAHRAMLPQVARVVVNSTLLQADHAHWVGMNPADIAVCPNGIDSPPVVAAAASSARARVRAAHGIADEAIVIINVGRFSAEKGQRSLVEANRLLLADRPASRPFVWLLWGDGLTLPDVRGAAEALGMTNMIFVGRTSAVRDMLCASDIFVMPSDFEGMPNAMMEAMTCGLPCVSTNRSGALDVARDGREALYYSPADSVQLAAHLRFLMADPAEASAMGARALARIHEFSVPRFVDAFEAVLEEIRAPASPR
jgi:glycosyltransferase involved in cell wall biosynthesis